MKSGPSHSFVLYMKINIDSVKEKVITLIEPVINDLDIALDHVELSQMKGKLLLRVFIDKEAGVKIDDCEHVSREIEAILDVEDPIPAAYVLEVSSPGLDRPLRGPKDFKRFAGNSVRLITQEPIDKQTFFTGKISEAGDNEVVLLLPNNKEVTISYKNISKARLEVEV